MAQQQVSLGSISANHYKHTHAKLRATARHHGTEPPPAINKQKGKGAKPKKWRRSLSDSMPSALAMSALAELSAYRERAVPAAVPPPMTSQQKSSPGTAARSGAAVDASTHESSSSAECAAQPMKPQREPSMKDRLDRLVEVLRSLENGADAMHEADSSFGGSHDLADAGLVATVCIHDAWPYMLAHAMRSIACTYVWTGARHSQQLQAPERTTVVLSRAESRCTTSCSAQALPLTFSAPPP